jgi:uncharacterized protein YggT (Ycf19 family)
MAQRAVIVDDGDNVARPAAADRAAFTIGNLVYLLFGILEALLAFRLVFRLLGANPASSFVDFIYNATEPFVAPFYGIFGEPTIANGVTGVSVFDTSTMVAMLVYGLVAWILVRIIAALSGRPTV